MRAESQETAERPRLFLITGIMAAGKSAVAQALAERLPRSVHLRGDVFRRMIVRGRADMDLELSTDAEEQLHLRNRIAATVAALYLEARFNVIYQDIIIGPVLADVVDALRQHPLYVVVLCPEPAVVAVREAARAKRGYRDARAVEAFDHVLRASTPRVGLWLDTSHLTVAETIDALLANLDGARVSCGTEP
ncbi:MAG TPA: AAA family ATPase [Herpetosiphonaceae bacterium]|nr:AAA family ATPase [Herpetosiphonaceae bacterium]